MNFILRRYNKNEFRFYKNVKESSSFVIFEDSMMKFMIFYKFSSEHLLFLYQENYTKENREDILNQYSEEYLIEFLKERLNENEICMIKSFKEDIRRELTENVNRIENEITELSKEKEKNNVLLISLSVTNKPF